MAGLFFGGLMSGSGCNQDLTHKTRNDRFWPNLPVAGGPGRRIDRRREWRVSGRNKYYSKFVYENSLKAADSPAEPLRGNAARGEHPALRRALTGQVRGPGCRLGGARQTAARGSSATRRRPERLLWSKVSAYWFGQSHGSIHCEILPRLRATW